MAKGKDTEVLPVYLHPDKYHLLSKDEVDNKDLYISKSGITRTALDLLFSLSPGFRRKLFIQEKEKQKKIKKKT
jgi:hypothetical protein